MNNTNKTYNRIQTKPVGMPIPPNLQAQYLNETFGWTSKKPLEQEQNKKPSKKQPQQKLKGK